MKRHEDALMIQGGACNPRAIARSLVSAVDEACDTSGLGHPGAGKDAAVRLIMHQLAHVLWSVDLYDLPINQLEGQSWFTAYSDDTAECRRKAS